MDLLEPNRWERLSDLYRSALPFTESSVQVQIYQGYQQSILEITRSLASLFSHKKTIAVSDRAEPALLDLAASFSSDGYKIKTLSREDIEDPSEWFPDLQSELLFVLVSQDDPVTSRLNDFGPLFDAMEAKRVFKLVLSHATHRFGDLKRPGPYEGRILSLRPDRALFVGGERCRVQSTVARILPWEMDDPGTVGALLKPWTPVEADRLKEAVLGFESALPEGFHPYFKSSDSRLHDRAVFWHPELDGLSLITELASRLSISLMAPGQTGLLETTSGCRWSCIRYRDWLLQQGESPECIRGLVMVSAEIADQRLLESLNLAAEKILRIQSGR